MEEIHRIIEAIQLSDRKSVLATIIHVEGSAYRKEGTSMLFQEDGTQIGTLSGGCLEEDLALRAKGVIKEGFKRTFVFDMRDEDDLSWGQGSGCNGLIYVLLEPLDQQRRMELFRLKKHLDQREPVKFICKLTDDFQGRDHLYILANGETFGSWKEDVPEERVKHITKRESNHQVSGLRRYVEDKYPMFIHYFRPQPRLIIIGAGSDAVPLVSFAKKAGFTIVLADWRDAFCNEQHFPDADQIIVGFPHEIIQKLCLNPDDFIILMTHQFQRDQEILSLLQDKNLNYIGVLGSRNRLKRLFGKKENPASIRSPVGIPIGAEGPEEIAISILAEVIHTLRIAEKHPVTLKGSANPNPHHSMDGSLISK